MERPPALPSGALNQSLYLFEKKELKAVDELSIPVRLALRLLSKPSSTERRCMHQAAAGQREP